MRPALPLLLALPALAVLAGAAASAEVLRIDSEVERADGSRESGRLWIDGSRVRMEFGRDPAGGARWTWIYRGDRELLWALGRRGERYAEIPEDELEALGRQLASARREVDARLAGLPAAQRAMAERLLGPAARATAAAPRADRIGDEERETTLDGVEVEVHALRAGERRVGELWLASWGDAGVARRKLRVLRGLARFQRELLDQLEDDAALQQAAPPFELFDQLGGYPLRMTTPAATTRFGRPVEVEVPDGHFELPPDARPVPAVAILRPARETRAQPGDEASGSGGS